MDIQPQDRMDVLVVLQFVQQRVLDELADAGTVEDMYEPYARFVYEAATLLRHQTNDARLSVEAGPEVETGPEEVGDTVLHEIAGRIVGIFSGYGL